MNNSDPLKNYEQYANFATGQTRDFIVILPNGMGHAFDGFDSNSRTLLEAKYGYWRIAVPDEALNPYNRSMKAKQITNLIRSVGEEEVVAAGSGYNYRIIFQNPNAARWFQQQHSSPDLVYPSPQQDLPWSSFNNYVDRFQYNFSIEYKPWRSS